MNKLPIELLHNVFIQLAIIQKKECMLVCKQWSNIIRDKSLFHTIIVDGVQSVHHLLCFLRQKPTLAAQVNCLVITHFPAELEKSRLLLFFPNLKTIKLSPDNENTIRPLGAFSPEQQEEFQFESRTFNHVQYLQDFYYCELTRLLISNGSCSHLATLILKVNTVDKTPSDLFPLLKNMPILKNLSIHRCPLAIDTFEMLHTNIPSLESLDLSGIKLLQGSLPSNITPARSLTRLTILTHDDDWEGTINYIQYIHRKYSNLKHLICEFDISSWCPEFKDVYDIHFSPLLQSLSPQLQSLRLSGVLDEGFKVIEMLDESGGKLKNLVLDTIEGDTVFDILISTKQFKYIENMTISNLYPDQNLENLKNMERLNSLKLYFNEYASVYEFTEDEDEDEVYKPIDLNELFQLFPNSLTSIAIKHLPVRLNNVQDEKQTFGIKELSLDYITVEHEWRLEKFISNCFPNLHTLIIKNSLKGNNIMLPNHPMSYIEMSNLSFSGINVSLVTKEGTSFYSTDERLRHTPSKFENLLFPVSKKDIGDRPYITITCASLEKLVLGGKEAYFVSKKYKFQSITK